MNYLTLLLAIGLVGLAFVLIALRIIFIKGGEFRGSCSTNNPFLKNKIGECPICGALPEEGCRKDETKTPERLLEELEGR